MGEVQQVQLMQENPKFDITRTRSVDELDVLLLPPEIRGRSRASQDSFHCVKGNIGRARGPWVSGGVKQRWWLGEWIYRDVVALDVLLETSWAGCHERLGF